MLAQSARDGGALVTSPPLIRVPSHDDRDAVHPCIEDPQPMSSIASRTVLCVRIIISETFLSSTKVRDGVQ